jgi:perosamine synthetase
MRELRQDFKLRLEMMAAFKVENSSARVFFWPLSSLPSFEPEQQNTVARDISERAIKLPSFHDISNKETERVVDTLAATLGKV